MYVLVGILVGLLALPHLLVRWRETLHTADVAHPNGQSIPHEFGHSTYYDSGHGPVIVLLHGFGGWHATWHAMAPALVALGYRVISIDAIGAGASARATDPRAYTTATQARLVMAVLAQLDITHYTVVGHSYGGRIALQIALYAPQQVQQIIVLAPEVMATTRPPIAKLVVIPLIGYALAYWSTAPMLVQYGLRGVSKRPAWVAAQHANYARSARVRGHLAGQICQSAAPKDGDMPVPLHLDRIQTPVCAIWGANDPVFPAQHGIALVERMPNAQIAVIPDTGHVPHEEAFSETLTLMRQALDQQPLR